MWGDDQTAATFDDAKGENRWHYVDAQTLITAQRLALPLVTADKARRNGVPVMSAAKVLAIARDMTTG